MRHMATMILLVGALAMQSSTKCDIHDMMATFTGKNRTANGKMLYEYRCPGEKGHLFWQVVR